MGKHRGLLGIFILFAMLVAGCGQQYVRSPGSTNQARQPTTPAVYISEKDPEEMVLIPAGHFLMGSEQ